METSSSIITQERGPGGFTLVELGHRLRSLREKQGMTLAALAEEADLSKGYISQIESGKKRPHWSTLMRLVHKLDGTLCRFLMPGEIVPATHRVQTGGGDRTIPLAGNLPDEWGRVERGDQEGYTWIMTPEGDPPLHAEVLRFRLPPHASWTPESISISGWLVAFGLYGETLLETGRLDRDEFLLHEGHTLAFDGRGPHRFRNCTDTPSEVILTVTPPGV